MRGAVRNYDWGVVDGMREWGVPADGCPQAELWFGCHPAAPSPVAGVPGRTLLDSWGAGSTPLLTKILAAATPLSLQVHPTAGVLRRWRGDRGAQALLADQAEKTEMLIAIRPFTCLVDWGSPETAGRLLAAAGATPAVLAALDHADMPAAARMLLRDHSMSLPPDAWLTAARAAAVPPLHHDVLRRVTAAFGADPGVAVACLLRPVQLQPGAAVLVPAGVPHAYVHGLGVEVMTSSDNVLRLGLTSKTVAVPYALAALDSGRRAAVAPPPASGRYNWHHAPFDVAVLSGAGRIESPGGAYRLVLSLHGRSRVVTAAEAVDLSAGEAVAVPAECDRIEVGTDGSAVTVRAVP